MRTFALNPKGIPERIKKVLEASRTSSLPGKEQLQYFRAMISDIEKEDIATANYKDGFNDGMEKGMEKGKDQRSAEIARRMLEMRLSVETIAQATGFTVEQIQALVANVSK